jgi:ureidoacrylate peracid hydrolase
MVAIDLKSLKPERTCLLMVDMQNDFLHEEGAYARAGCTAPALSALAPRLASVADVVRRWGGWTAVTLFTLVPGRGGEPFVAPHLKRLRPFLAKGDFAPGSWGQDAVAALKPVDFLVEKVAYSAFHQSRLDFTLRKAGIDTLIVGGIVTNGGVASTLRGAHVLEYDTVLLSDGAAAFDPRVHAVTVEALGAISPVVTCAELIGALGPS